MTDKGVERLADDAIIKMSDHLGRAADILPGAASDQRFRQMEGHVSIANGYGRLADLILRYGAEKR